LLRRSPPRPARHQRRSVTAIGRSGSGPGEFEFLGEIHVHGDSLLAGDPDQSRVSVFDSEGRFVRSFRLETKEGHFGPRLQGVLAEGRIVVRTIAATDLEPGADPGVRRRRNTLWLHATDGAILDSSAAVPGSESFDFIDHDGYLIQNTPIPFPPTAVTAPGDRHIIVADTERPEYRVYGADGALERTPRCRPS